MLVKHAGLKVSRRGGRLAPVLGLSLWIAVVFPAAAQSLATSCPGTISDGVCNVGSATTNVSGVLLSSQGTNNPSNDKPGGNGSDLDLHNTSDRTYNGTGSQNVMLGVVSLGGQANSGDGTKPGGDGGSLNLYNSARLQYLGSPTSNSPVAHVSDYSAAKGIWDDAGIIFGMYSAGRGGNGGKGSGDLFDNKEEQSGGMGGAGGTNDKVRNTGSVEIVTTMPSGAVGVLASSVGGNGGRQDSGASTLGSDVKGGIGGRTHQTHIENAGRVSLTGKASNLLYGLAAESYGGDGGSEAQRGGAAGDARIEHENGASIEIEATDVQGVVFPRGIAGIHAYVQTGDGSQSDDNSNRGGAGGPFIYRTYNDTDLDVIRVSSEGDVTVTARGFVPLRSTGLPPSEESVPETLKPIDLSAQSGGIVAIARGGRGGNSPEPDIGDANDAGNGAGASSSTPGLSVHVMHKSGSILTYGDYLSGIFAASRGGDGGTGRGQADAGDGGTGLDVRVETSGKSRIATDGTQAIGISAQSVGGNGGYQDSDGDGFVDLFGPNAGNSGNGGTVLLHTKAQWDNGPAVSTTGQQAHAIRAQSLGGAAGGANGSFVIVGAEANAGGGGDGGHVLVDNRSWLSTLDDFAFGILAQSIGGGGGDVGTGDYGDATGLLVLAGSGGDGGDGGLVHVQQGGKIRTGQTLPAADDESEPVTTGNASIGILAQSVGGGGGTAGTATGLVSVGGVAGANGTGGDATIDIVADTDIATLGDFAFGLMSQSVGGGGGVGGTAMSLDILLPSVSVGGAGQAGGTAGKATVNNRIDANNNAQNSGNYLQIATEGANAHAIVAQSLGGGGGSGGNAYGLDAGITGTIDYAVGAGGGGDGKATRVELDRFALQTAGGHANGILAQSIGGSGGIGGMAGGASAGLYFSGSLSLGGSGGDGGNASTVDVALSQGNIFTGIGVARDGLNPSIVTDSHAVVAQSIGGGGGMGGSTYGKAVVKEFDIPDTGGSVNAGVDTSISVGGSGGSGGDGSAVKVGLSDVTIQTQGQGSHGVLAQSIGGGGGVGGSASAKGGAIGSPVAALEELLESVKKGVENIETLKYVVKDVANAITPDALRKAAHGGYEEPAANGPIKLDDQGRPLPNQGEPALDDKPREDNGLPPLDDEPGTTPETIRTFIALNLNFAVGGDGGAGGTGKDVSVDLRDDTSILTTDAVSYGVLMQSISDGGGAAGAGDAESLNIGSGYTYNATVGIGGKGGKGEKAGDLFLHVDDTSQIGTRGNKSTGILMQSIGGGGGTSEGTSFGVYGTIPVLDFSPSLTVNVGRTGPNGGAGGNIDQIDFAGGIDTYGADADGLVVQSIGGSGGAGGAQGPESASGGFFRNVFELLEDEESWIDARLTLGGRGGTGADGGNIGGVKNASGQFADANGDGRADIMRYSGDIRTSGAFADGMILQSIGAGGGLGGVGVAQSSISIIPAIAHGGSGGAAGNGGNINYGFDGGTIGTGGNGALGVFMQSIGGGGGMGGSASRARCGRLSLGGGLEVRDFIEAAKEQQEAQKDTRNPYVLPAPAKNRYAQEAPEGESERCFEYSKGIDNFDGHEGSAGDGGTIAAADTGVSSKISIATIGNYSAGWVAQSIGAGGGTTINGDNKIIVIDDPTDPDYDADNPPSPGSNQGDNMTQISAIFGGAGGSSGHGGNIAIDNDFSITTSGKGAPALIAQSIGAGGGLGQTSGLVGLTLGAYDAAGYGGAVSVKGQSAGVAIDGEASHGVVAQSVGGGGGMFIGELSSWPVAEQEVVFELGSQTDGHGAGGRVSVDMTNISNGNTPHVMTLGRHARAIVAQSVGAGGGLFTAVDANGYGPLSGIEARLGGLGSGTGGNVSISTAGTVSTGGAGADAVLAQSVGSGGGSTDFSLMADDQAFFDTIRLGVDNRSNDAVVSDTGGAVDVQFLGNTGKVADLRTTGDQAYGVLMQSIADGGGLVDITGNAPLANATLGAQGVALSPAAQSGTVGGKVSLTDYLGSLYTKGRNAHGAVAQSIAGGGGVLRSTGGTSSVRLGQQTAIGGRKAGAVKIALGAPTFSTVGDGAYGLVGQSIGGGGGLFSQGDGSGISHAELGSDGGGLSDGGAVSISWIQGGLYTSGVGAHGIVAQSIGGGGGLAGNPSLASGIAAGIWDQTSGQTLSAAQRGKGDNVAVNVDRHVEVSGDGAAAVIAQSIGGGGGLAGTKEGLFMGRTSSDDSAASASGTVDVTVGESAKVIATGDNGIGILAQSAGGATHSGAVAVEILGQVAGGAGADGTGVTILGADSDDQLHVAEGGTLSAASGIAYRYLSAKDSGASSIAYIDGAADGDMEGYYRNGDSFAIYESESGGFDDEFFVLAGAGTPVPSQRVGALRIVNGATGRLTGASQYLADVENNGQLVVGRGATDETLTIAGDFRQTQTGTLITAADFVDGRAGRVHVKGNTDLDGELTVALRNIVKNREVSVLQVDGALTGRFAKASSALFDFEQRIDNGALRLTAADARINAGQFDLNDHEAGIARYLEAVYDSGNAGYGGLLAAADDIAAAELAGSGARFGLRLQELSPGALLADAASNLSLSQQRFDDLFDCSDRTARRLADGEGCVTGQIRATAIDQGSSDGVGYDGQLYGFSVAAREVPLMDNVTVAGAIGYDRSDFDGDYGLSHSEGDIFHASVGITQHWNGFALTGAVGGSYAWQDTDRRIDFLGDRRVARSDHQTASVGGRVRVAYAFGKPEGYIKPFVDVDVIRSQADGFRESGAGEANLVVDASKETAFRVTPAVEIGREFSVGETLTITGALNGGVSLSSVDNYATSAGFADAPGEARFITNIAVPDTLGRVGASIQASRSERLALGLRYDGAYGDHFDSHAGSLQAIWSFN